MYQIWNFQLSYYVNTKDVLVTNITSITTVLNESWIKNGLPILKWLDLSVETYMNNLAQIGNIPLIPLSSGSGQKMK